MAEPEDLLAELTGAILDGTPVDWAAVEVRASVADQAFLAPLRLLDTVWTAARTAPGPPGAVPLDRWGHLRVLECLGRGASGEVYRAWDPRLEREVALKLLRANGAPEEDAASAIDEGRLLARVRHPNVVTIHGADHIDGRVGLWMELVDGRTLEEIVRERKALTPADVSALGLELCHAVAAVHAAGLLHRDIKAQNVMRTEDGRIVLMDFGTGRDLTHPSEGVAGTPLYLAPELLNGGEASVRSDIYSLGVLLYHLLTGSYPVRAENLRGLVEAHQRRDEGWRAPAMPGVPARLHRIVDRAIDPDPGRRYDTTTRMAADLARLKPPSRLRTAIRFAAAIVGLALLVWTTWEVHAWRVDGKSATLTAIAAHLPAGASTPAAGMVLAVLPFENLGEPDEDGFADGLSQEILRNLAGLDGLDVRSWTSSFAFKGRSRDPAEIAGRLGVSFVLEGSIRRTDHSVTVTARLVQVPADRVSWSRRFDGDYTVADMFDIQDEISKGIADSLRLTLGAGQRRYDTDTFVYDRYLNARALIGQTSRTDPALEAETRHANTARAIDLLRKVVAEDRAFAPAWAALADAYRFHSQHIGVGMSPDEALPLMQEAAATALMLDETLAEGHAAMGLVHARELRWPSAVQSFRQAIDLDPTLTWAYAEYVSSTLVPLQRFDEAEALLDVARQRDPASALVHARLGYVKTLTAQYGEAIAHLEDAGSLDPGVHYLEWNLARALTFSGDWPAAMPIWERLTAPGWVFWSSLAQVSAGRRDAVDRMIATESHPYRLAVMYAALEDTDRTFDLLHQAADTVPQRVASLLAFPEMALLRGDPRLNDLRRRLNLPQAR